MQRFVYDVAVVGGGIIGTATARELLKRNPLLKIALIEKESAVATHQSGHNSGVVHAGIYYKPGSLKAKLCVEGLELTYKYCSEKNIPFKKCGKMIVAVKESEIPGLQTLYDRAVQNGVKDVSLINAEGIKNLEPNISGLKAIWSPNTGIVDWAEVTRSFAEDSKVGGADFYFNFKVKKFFSTGHSSKSSIAIQTDGKDIFSKHVITCAGLYSDKLATLTGCSQEPRIIPFRGEYLVLKPEKSHLVKTNVYPVPNPDLPFLGLHITPRMDGSVWLGPNAILAFKHEGYRLRDFSFSDTVEFLRYRGVRKLIMKHFAYGLDEFYRGINISAQVELLKQYLPQLTAACVERGPSGVRAQAMDKEGHLVDDFVTDFGVNEFKDKVLHVRNAPSPAATSSLSIAKLIVDKVEAKFGLRTTQ